MSISPERPLQNLTKEERAANWKQYQLRVKSFAVPEVDVFTNTTTTAAPTIIPLNIHKESVWECDLEEDEKNGKLRRSFEDMRALRKFVNDAVNVTPTSPTRVYVSRRKKKRPRPKSKRPNKAIHNAANTPGGELHSANSPLTSSTPSPPTLRVPLPPLQHFATHYRRGFTMGVTPRGENPLLVHTVKWEIEYSPNALTCEIQKNDTPILTGTCVLYNEPDGILLIQWHENSNHEIYQRQQQQQQHSKHSKQQKQLQQYPSSPSPSPSSSTGHRTKMDYLSLGKDAIRLVSSKRRGRVVDPVYISVELRLSSLIKFSSKSSR